MRRYTIDPQRSTVVVDARSSVGPIAWEGVGPAGEFGFHTSNGSVDLSEAPFGWLELPLTALASGNRVYDAELLRRIDARRHPVARIELAEVVAAETGGRYHARGRLTFHGVTRSIAGELDVDVRDDGTVLVTGEQDVDIRDFGLPAPTMLLLKVYPDVRVHLVCEGRPVD